MYYSGIFRNPTLYPGALNRPGLKNKVSIIGTENPKPLFNRNTPPKLTFHTFRSTFDHSKVLFWLPSDFWQIFSNNVKQQMPISQNMFDHKATKMVPIVLDL